MGGGGTAWDGRTLSEYNIQGLCYKMNAHHYYYCYYYCYYYYYYYYYCYYYCYYYNIYYYYYRYCCCFCCCCCCCCWSGILHCCGRWRALSPLGAPQPTEGHAASPLVVGSAKHSLFKFTIFSCTPLPNARLFLLALRRG